MERPIITAKQMLLSIQNEPHDLKDLVSIMELSGHKCGATSIKDLSNKIGKSTQWIGKSNDYRKCFIGSQRVVVPGVKNNDLPF